MTKVIKVCRWCGRVYNHRWVFEDFNKHSCISKNETAIHCLNGEMIKVRVELGNCPKCRRSK